MSTCSTATSACRGNDIRRRLFYGVDADATGGHRLRDLERDWDAYKASRSGAPRHRRSRSAITGTPSSAVTAAGDPDDDLADFLIRCSPRRLVYSIQQDGSDGRGGGTDSAAAVSVERGNGGQLSGSEEDASSVGSVEVKYSMASPSSCSCHRHCAALGRSYSTCSSCTVATEFSFSPAGGGVVVVEDATKTEERRCVTSNNRLKWFTAIALVVVGAIVAMDVMELGMDVAFLVPT